jgi:hypothetical protein
MRRMWQPRSATTMLGAVLVAASLLVALTGTAQAQPSQHGTPAKQVARRGWATLTGYCYRTSTRVSAYMSIDSDEYGTGYANIYRRKSTGNVLVARGTRSGSRFYFNVYEPYVSGASYFETFGFNSPHHKLSGSDDCNRV